ncbi:hypothetical protein N431DRAFT_351187 [Stipitochalara longipes BDJ]|nr:hypothetical protein N431DRAFT_351187 [Stipitochalara longipes BDJ]
MEVQAQPILERGIRGKRKFGRYDFERFDHRSSSHASVGHATFDKVEVNCKFLFKKSQWGILGEHKNLAGIIYLDLSFRQPKGCQLHSATVSVTLDDEDKELRELGPRLRRRADDSQCPVQMTDCYGPKGFAGPEKIVLRKKSLHLAPRGQFMGYGFGGLGIEKESSSTYSSRWKFSGHLLPGKSNDWRYKTLKWDLVENDLENQSMHSNEVHTAFTFEHSGQPFLMRVEIQGKLRKLHGRVKDKLMKFPSSAKKEDGSVVTLINFGERFLFKTPLDERARELEFEMEMANLHAIPMEVSDPKPVTFQNITQNSRLSNMANIIAPSAACSQQQSTIPSGSLQPQSSTSTESQPLLGAENPMIQDALDPMIVDLAQAFVDLHTLDGEQSRQSDNANVSSMADFALDATERSETDEVPSGSKEAQQESSDQQMLLLLLRMPAFLAFLRVLVGLLGFLGQTPSSTPSSTPLPTPSPSTVGDELDGINRLPPANKAMDRPEVFTSSRRNVFPGKRDNRTYEHAKGEALLKDFEVVRGARQ